MKSKIKIKLRDNFEQETYEVDGYSTHNGVLEIYTYTNSKTIINKIVKIFPLTNILEISITGERV